MCVCVLERGGVLVHVRILLYLYNITSFIFIYAQPHWCIPHLSALFDQHFLSSVSNYNNVNVAIVRLYNLLEPKYKYYQHFSKHYNYILKVRKYEIIILYCFQPPFGLLIILTMQPFLRIRISLFSKSQYIT